MALNRNEVGLQFSLSVDFGDAVRQLQVFQSRFRDMGADVQGQIRQMQASMSSFGRTAQQTGQQLGDSFRGPLEAVRQQATSLQDAFSNLGNVLTVGVTLPLAGLSAAAIKSAVDLDKTRARLAALMGSTEEANRVISELNKLVAQTPGLTSAFAMDAFAQMRALGTIGEESILRLTAALGRLNAVSSLENPQGFVRNIIQIYDQAFERGDIKEALGQVPIFEQLLEQAFGTNDPDALRKLKESGALTLSMYLQGFTEAIENNPAFANAQETLQGRITKTFGQLQTALVPLGERLFKPIVAAVEAAVPVLTGLLDLFGKFPSTMQAMVVGGGLFIGLIGPMIRITGELQTAFRSLLTVGDSVAVMIANISAAITRSGGLIAALNGLRLAILPILPVIGIVSGVIVGIGAGILYINQQLDGLAPKLKILTTAAALAQGGGGAGVFGTVSRIAERMRNRVPESGEPQLRTDEELAGNDPDTIRKRLAEQLKLTTEGQKKATKQVIDYEKTVKDIQERVGDNQLRLLEVQTQQQLAALKRRYDAQEISQQEFNKQSFKLQFDLSKAQLDHLKANREELFKNREATSNVQKQLEIEKQIVDNLNEQNIKLVQMGGLLDERAQRGTLPLFTVDPAQVEQALDMVDPILEDFRARQQARLDQITGLDTQAIRTRTEIIAIENQLELRQISRTEAQERINELLRQERDQRIASLQVQMQAIDITEEQSAKLAQQIELLRTQGETARQMGVGDVLQDIFESVRQPTEMLKDALNGIRAGAEQMIETLIMTGNLSGQAFLKMARASIAAMTAEATVAAIMQLAKGFGLLAIGDVAGAKAAFTSAALFKAVKTAAGGAIASAALGAIAPGGASESAGTGGRFVTGGTGRPETISLIQGQSGNRREPQVIVIRAETEPGVIVRKVVENVQNNGEMRQLIRQEIMQGVV